MTIRWNGQTVQVKAGLGSMKKKIIVVSVAITFFLVIVCFVFIFRTPVQSEAVTLEMENEATILRIAALLAGDDEEAKAFYIDDLHRGFKAFSPMEMKANLAEFEQSIVDYIKKYERTPKEQRVTKGEPNLT